jgi:predicted DNA-binding transcriptional regulator AlpA
MSADETDASDPLECSGRQRGQDSEELTEATAAVEALTERDRLLLTVRLLEQAGGEIVRDSRLQALVRARAEALLALDAAYADLGLTTRDVISKKQFEEACQRLGIRQDYFKVRRAWGSWPTAVGVYCGETPWDRAGFLAVLRLNSHPHVVWRQRQDPRSSLLAWLAVERGRLNRRNYNTWARERNAELGDGEPTHLTAGGIEGRLRCVFEDAVRRVQRGEDDPAVEDETFAIAGHRLLTAYGVALVMNHNLGRTTTLSHDYAADEALPAPVAAVGQLQLWLRDDIERYRRGETVEREPFELSSVILDTGRLAERFDREPATIYGLSKTARIAGRAPDEYFPPPTGKLRRVPWWDAEEVEQWLREHPDRDPRARAAARARTLAENSYVVDGTELLTATGVGALLSLSRSTVLNHRKQRRLPPEAVTAPVLLWAREDIERYARGERPKRRRRRGYLQRLVLTSQQVADQLGITTRTLVKNSHNSPHLVPPPKYRTRMAFWWDSAEVKAWIATHGRSDQRVQRRRSSTRATSETLAGRRRRIEKAPSDGRSI